MCNAILPGLCFFMDIIATIKSYKIKGFLRGGLPKLDIIVFYHTCFVDSYNMICLKIKKTCKSQIHRCGNLCCNNKT